jgi:hypothetical protein
MVYPLLLGSLAGAGLGFGAGSMLTKKGDSYTYNTSNTSTRTDSRSWNIQYPTYQIQIDSPLASQTTKKEATASTATSIPNTIEQAGGGSGIDLNALMPIALILGGAYIVGEIIK